MRADEAVRTMLLLGALAGIAAGCGGTQPDKPDAGGDAPDSGTTVPDSGTPDAGDECMALTLGAQDFQANLFGQLTGVRYAVSPAIDGETSESLMIELYDSSTPGLPALTVGTFQLGVAPNDKLGTCQHCVWMPVDWDTVSPLSTVFIATEGSFTLTQVDDPLTPVITGGISGLVLREATVSDTGEATLKDGGRCARVQELSFDTSPTPGRACGSAEDCGNPMLEVCSPATGTCGPHECGDLLGCPSERPVCMVQYGNMSEGACYAVCNPSASGTCAAGQDCLQQGVDPTFGVCMRRGSGTQGQACTVEDTSTSCAKGMTCSAKALTCTNTCSYFAADPGCQADHACSVLGVCDPVSTSGAATFGETCADGSELAQGCAADSGAFRGICFSYLVEEPLVCEEACFGDQGCEPEEFCALRFSSGLGVCKPDPICGDGELGEVGEVCDDGNTTTGDGCSADCQIVEYDAICPNAPLLAAGTTNGDTTHAWDGFQATCQLGIARSEVYRFAPPSRGRLTLTVSSAKTHVVSVRESCADALSETACKDADLSGTSELTLQVTSTDELTVLVSAFTVLEQAPFTLQTEFVAESCGDGILAGLEVCDDGNTNANDGCSSDCSTIEYAAYCAQATTLTASVTGDNTNAPSIYTTTCAGSVLGSGLDRLYQYTAPSTGTVRFRLEPDTSVGADLVLAVFDSCGTPAGMTELGCSSVYDIEQVDVQVTAGQTLTVLVEGFHPHSVSPFTLTAQMLP